MGTLAGKPVAVGSGTIQGVDAVPVTVEATMRAETSMPRILGSVDAVVREAYHRVLSAFVAQQLPSPRGSPVLNFLPAGVRKSGSGFDLPMALALAAAGGAVPRSALEGLAAFGEVSLEGRILPVRGAVPVALAARQQGWTRLLLAPEDAHGAAVVPGIAVYAVRTLREAVVALADERSRPEPLALRDATSLFADAAARDLADLRGHRTPKRALAVAAAGRHNLLFVGPPGSGKSALSHRIQGLLPPPEAEECLEILKIRSAHGDPTTGAPLPRRPFRAPHHSSSAASILGGGPEPRPGEVSLAHRGVLFLDELPEFRREALEGLRQPLEEGRIAIARTRAAVDLPADFLLIAAMNPCPCGYDGCTERPCTCTPALRSRYRARISGPLLDRFDLRVEVPFVPPDTFAEPVAEEWTTAGLRAAVERAVGRQRRRQSGPNGRLEGRALQQAVGSDPAIAAEVARMARVFALSGRDRVRILRLARTLADLDGEDVVRVEHVRLGARLRGTAIA